MIAFLFVHHYARYFGHYGFDDVMGYGYYGKKWVDGAFFFLNEDFFSYRWGFISLRGLFYALFGVNDEASAITSSLVLLLTVGLIFRVLNKETRVSVALATFAAFALIYSHHFLPPCIKDCYGKRREASIEVVYES